MKLQAIYEPKGRAGEYSRLALNVYRTCVHGCRYCYVPGAARMKVRDFHRPGARPRELGQKLVNDAKTLLLARNQQPVHLCFLCDPYQSQTQDDNLITRQSIQTLKSYGQRVRILTKAGNRATRDFDLLGKTDEFGVTLTLLDEQQRQEWEPFAASNVQRIETLKRAREAGIGTWASFEPVLDPEQTLQLIELAAPYLDRYAVGRWNHAVEAHKIDWHKFAHAAQALAIKLGIPYYLKDDLRAAL